MLFDHIGFVVRDLVAGRETLRDGLGISEWTEAFRDPVNDVIVQFGRTPVGRPEAPGDPGICYELITPLSSASPVTAALARGVNLLNHVAYRVAALGAEADRLEEAGFLVLGPPKPAVAYGGKPIQFFLSRTRLMIELIEAPAHQHVYHAAAGAA